MAFTFKKIYSWLHLWLGISFGLIFSTVALTGAIMVFEKEIDEWVSADFYFTTNTGNQAPLPLDSLLTLSKTYAGNKKIERILISGEEGSRNILFQTKGKKDKRIIIAIDPYTGALKGKRVAEQTFFKTVERLHRNLLIDETGKTITDICCLAYLVILITGLLLWLPKNRKGLKQRLKIKWDAKAKRLNWDIHAVGGFYTLPVLFLIAFTGLTWSYKWFNNGIYLLFDGKKQVKKEAVLNRHLPQKNTDIIAKVYAASLTALPADGNTSIFLPEKKNQAIRITKERLGTRPNIVDELAFDANDGQLLDKQLYETQTTGNKARRLVLPIHTGSIYGWPTKLLALICCLLGASLPFTGFYIWWGKKQKKKPGKRAPIKQPAIRPVPVSID